MAKSKDKTLLQKMQEICPYHIAKYVQWYLSDQKLSLIHISEPTRPY